MSAKLFRTRFVVISLFIAGLAAGVFFRSGLRSEANSAASALVPIIGATKSVAVVVGNADADADPGETLEYTVTINNTGPDPATGVAINDTLQNITTEVAGSTIASPIAVNDTFASIGNVGISVPLAGGVLANDLNPNGSGTLVVQSVNQAGLQGLLSLNTTTGAFDFTPNAGFEGSTSFTYTLANGTGLTNTATVTINVTGMIWFVNASLGVNGDGRLGAPFNSLANFNASPLDEANDNIFLFESATAYTGGVTLLSGQKLIGQDATATLGTIAGVSVPPFSNALPAMNSANGTVTNLTSTMTLVGNTTLRGFSVNTTTSTGISGGAVSGVTTSELKVTTTTGTAVSLSGTGGTLSFTSISANGAANGISLLNTTGSFTVTGEGGSCTVGTPTCTGGRIQNTVGADGATAGIGVRLQNATAVSLTRMRIDNHPNFAVRGFSVVGFTLDTSLIDGTNGTSQAVDDSAVYFTELTGSAAITNTTITNGYEFVVYVVNTVGTLNRLTIDSSTLNSVNATNGDDALHLEAFNAAVMNVTVTNSVFTSGRGDIINVNGANTSNVDLVFRGNRVSNNHPAILSGGGGLTISSGGAGSNSTLTYDISCNKFRDAKGNALTLFRGSGSGTMSGTIFNNEFGVAGVLLSGSSQATDIHLDALGSSTHTALIKNNTLREYNETAILASVNSGNSTMNLTIIGNTADSPPSGGAGVFTFGGLFADVGALGGDTNTLNLKFGGAGAEANNFVDGDPFNFNDVSLNRLAAAGTTFNYSRVTSGSNDPTAITLANNTNPLTITVSGTITPVNTVPALPAAINQACSPPPFTTPIDGVETTTADDKLSLIDLSYGSPSEILTGIEPLIKYSANSEAVSSETVSLTSSFTSIRETFRQIYNRLGEAISPTVIAQEKIAKTLAPESGETVTKSLGTLPAGESIVVRFRATVDNGPYASGVNSITNTASISGSNFANVNSTTSSIALDAAPDLVVTKTEGGGTTQPGATLLYTLSYSNATATNGQNAANVVLTETVPANTTFNATASLPSVWSCANGSAAGTSCTLNIGAVNAGAAAGTATFAVNVLAALPAGVIQVSNSSSIAENPNVNGTDRNAANNTGPDTTNIIGNWLGGTSTDWFTAANWSNGLVPPTGNNVSVPNVANQPIVTTADVTLNNMNLIGENVTINAGRTITVNGVTTLGANNINGAGTLNLGTAATITRTTGQVECTLIKNFGATGLFTFPVGTTGAYSPVDANVTAGTGQLSVKANTGTAPLAPVPLNAARTLQRYWTLSGSGITSNITFNYLNGDVPVAPNNENIWNVIRVVGGTSAIRYPAGPNVILNAAANTFTLNGVQVYSDWTAGEPLAPTASSATVAGRVFGSNGRGVYGSFVSITDANGNARLAITNPFGYYSFAEVQTGQSYVISVRDKRHQFAPRVINVSDDLTDVNFSPIE